MSQVERLTERSLAVPRGAGSPLSIWAAPWVTGVVRATCPMHAPSPPPQRGAVPRQTLVLQVCTPGRLPRWGTGSVGPLFPEWVTQR